MKKTYHFILFTVLLLSGCSKPTTEDIISDVSFTIALPEQTEIIKVNGELKCTNINTEEVVIMTSIHSLNFNKEMLKGLYIIHFTGTVICRDNLSSNGKPKRMKGYIDDAVFLKSDDVCTINVKLYDL